MMSCLCARILVWRSTRISFSAATTVFSWGRTTDTSARYSTGSNVGSSSSSSDYETQLVPELQQGNDLRDGAGSGASDSSDDLVMSAVDLSPRYEQKLDAMTVKKLRQACRDRSLANILHHVFKLIRRFN